MKILCFIDSLGPGGAQRQLVTLALGLKKRGHQIRFLVYHQEDHFLPLLQGADISCQVIPLCSHMQRAMAVRRILQEGWQDVVLAFLEAASLYAEWACIPKQRWGLVVGERSTNPDMNKGTSAWLRQFHRIADAVICNSYTNQLMLERVFPFLKRKLFVVYNTVDLKLFSSFSDELDAFSLHGIIRPFRIVVVASYQELKNMMNVAKALCFLNEKQNMPLIVVDWYGGMPANSAAFKQVKKFIDENELSKSLHLHAATRNIASEFSRADAVGLFSFYEGLPNVVCEGMACGKPILLSNVCDASNLVKVGTNGFLCDPSSPEDIADKIIRLVALSELERQQMGLESRRMAEQLFAEDVVIDRYELILNSARNHQPVSAAFCGETIVPESAVMTVNRWLQVST